MELFIFDMDFNRLGIIDTYEKVEIEQKYHNHSELILTVAASEENTFLLLDNDENRIITKNTDINRGYIIEIVEYKDERQLEIIVIAKSLSIMTGWRWIEGQQRFSGNVEDVIKSFVNANAINPTNPNRVIPDLVLGLNDGINIDTDESYLNKQLDLALWEICTRYDMSFEILMNHEAKKYVFSTYTGTDRSGDQSINQHVIFSKAFDNVTLQSYVDDKANYRSTAYVIGADDTIVKVHDDISGFNRRELIVDLKSLQKKFQDENGRDVTLTDEEFKELLAENGLNRLSEYQRIRTFESEIDSESQFVFNRDYFLGDKVTNRNDELKIVTHARVATAKERYDRAGYHLSLEFGTSIPKLLDKIKRMVK